MFLLTDLANMLILDLLYLLICRTKVILLIRGIHYAERQLTCCAVVMTVMH